MISKALKKSILIFAAAFLAAGIMIGGQPREILGAAATNEASSNANLKSLSVNPGTMTPEFSPEVTSYTITVAEDVDKISVTCSTDAADSKVIEAGGFKGLEMGSNDAIITVQAADGTKQTYNLTIIRGEAETQDEENDEETGTTDDEEALETSANVPAVQGTALDGDTEYIPVGGESIYASFQVNTLFPQELLPEGFVEEDYNYKGTMVQSAYFATGDIRLLYLCAADGNSADFRIYYEDTDVFMDFLQFKGTDGKFIMPVRYQAQIKIPDNYTGSYLPWGDKVISCYIYTELTDNPIKTAQDIENEENEGIETEEIEEEPVNVEDLDEEVEFYLIYAMNNAGEENFYLYDYVEDTYQRYVERDTSYELDQSYFKYKEIAHQRFAVMCILIAILLVAVFCIINLLIRNRELKADLYAEDDEERDDDENMDDAEEHADDDNEEADGVSKDTGKKDNAMDDEHDKKEKPVKEKTKKDKPVKEKAAKEKAAKEKAVKEKQEEAFIDTSSLEEKIIGQLQQDQEKQEEVQETPVRKRKPSEFKMINLSREPEATGLDDDFEFEFINLDDD